MNNIVEIAEKKPLSLRKRIFFYVLTTVLVFIVLLLSGEVVIRIISSMKRNMASEQWISYSDYYMHPPNMVFEEVNDEGKTIKINTDKYGLRNEEIHVYGRKVVLVLGDSFIEGANTSYDSTFCKILEKYLSEKRVTVINGGVNGYSNYQSFLLLKYLYNKMKPDIVLLMVYTGNDLRDNYRHSNIPSLTSKENVTSTSLKRTTKSNLLKRIAKKSKLAHYIYSFKHDEISITDYYNFEIQTYKNDPEDYVVKSVNTTESILMMYDDFFQSKGIPFIISGIPSQAQAYENIRLISHFEYSRKNKELALKVIRDKNGYSFDNPSKYYEKICDKLNLPYYSLLPLFSHNKYKGLYCKVDNHWSILGQQISAKYVSNILKKNFLK